MLETWKLKLPVVLATLVAMCTASPVRADERTPLTRAALAAQFAGTDPGESYAVRLDAVRQLAQRFPGRIAPAGHQYREMGLFAGIYMQTLWQHESGRDELPIWYQVNRNLTLVPRAYMAEYEANPAQPYEQSAYVLAHPTRGGASAPVQVVETCRAWKDYFKAADAARRDAASANPLVRARGALAQRISVTKALWRAHTTGIRFALWQHAPELTQLAIPEEEMSFWRGWIRIVYFSEKISPSTTDLLLKPFLKIAMPPCSPLGRTACTVADQPLAREAFIRWLSYGKVDQDEFLAVFGGRPSPRSKLAAVHAALALTAVANAASSASPSPASDPALTVMRDPELAEAVRTGLSPSSLAIDPRDDIILESIVAGVRTRRQ